MTDTAEFNIAEALALIEEGLGTLTARDMVPTSEMADLLLDVRMLLAASVEAKEPVTVGS